MMDLNIDREVIFNGVTYRILEFLNSGNLLVTKKDDYDKGLFPLPVFIIPDKD